MDETLQRHEIPQPLLESFPAAGIYLSFITNFRFRFLVLSFDEKKLTLCFDMKNGESSLTSGFENQLPESTQIEPIELIHDTFLCFTIAT